MAIGVGVVPMSVVDVVDVVSVEGGREVAVMEVVGVDVAAEVGVSVVAMVTAPEEGVGMEVACVVEGVVVKVDTVVEFAVTVATGCVVERGGEVGSAVVVGVKVLVVTGVEVVDVAEMIVFVGVTADVIGGGELIPVVTGPVETSLVGVSVVFQVDVA